uniref:Ig-like domain-containing protein n=1 Tax=Schistosoma mansoni TaxID=6183 RepID=A0A5K4FE50_SCHMA
MCNSCHLQTNIEIFHCSHYGLTTLPGYIHENTIELNLSYNLIEILHEDSFTRLHNIQKLILAHNKIYKITERAFLPIMNSLIWLDLRFNQLISNYHNPFPVLAFSQLVYVSYLDLSGNELNYLPARFLYGMGMSLKRLEMSLLSSKIYTEPDTFDGLNRLHHLNLAYNIFANLMEDALNGLRPEHFSYLNLEGVKWTCDCHILWFRQWLNRLPKKALYINSKPGGECVSPSQYQHMALMYLNLTSLQCEPELMHTIPSHHDDKNDKNSVKRNLTDRVTTPIHVYGIEGENLTLVCSFISEPKMYIQWFYNGILIQPHWSHVIQTISPGIKFTTTLFFKQLDKTTDEGYYKCQASNYKGQASATFYVHVQKPIEQSNQLRLFNKNLNNKLDYTSFLFNPIIITIFIVVFNFTFIIIVLCIVKCIYKKRLSHQSHRKRLSNKALETNIEPHNVSYEKLITANCDSNMNNSNNSNIQPFTQINLNPINSNQNHKICTDFISTSSKLHNENLSNIREIDKIQQIDDRINDGNKCYLGDLLNNNNNKSILQSKLLNHSMKQGTPSPQSSDMGYLTSNASQNCESLIDLNPNHNEYNSSIKQLKPRVYYTLGVRSGNHSPELIYSLNNTNEKHHLTCSIDQDYSISDNSLSPKQMSCSPESYSFHQHSDKHQYGSQNTNVYHDKTFNQTSCPIHGLINKNENDFNPAYLIQNQNNSDCPIHGSKSFTNLGKSFYKNEYKLNKSKQYPNKSLSLNLNYSNRTFLESIKMNSLDETCDDIKNLQQHHRINCT